MRLKMKRLILGKIIINIPTATSFPDTITTFILRFTNLPGRHPQSAHLMSINEIVWRAFY
jgi:hypothetical protein